MRHQKHAKVSSKAKASSKKRKAHKTPIIFKGSLVVVVIFIITATIFKISELILTNTADFPKLEISLKDVTVEQINLDTKNIKYPNNTATITINNNSIDYSDIELKGHGNSTWNQPKKPYQIKFSKKTELFSQDKAKKWILLANSFDATHLRNDTAFYLEHLLDEEYAINGNFVELYIDEQYYGLYYLTEKVEIDEARVNLTDDLGIITELENLHSANENCITTEEVICLTVRDVVNSKDRDIAVADFVDNFNQFETALSKKDFKTIANTIDIDSFAKYYLLSEFTVNPDAYSSSFFFYKNGVSDKIHAGPGWDFDHSLGNTIWTSDGVDYDNFFSPFTDTALKDYTVDTEQKSSVSFADGISTIIYKLLDIPEFHQRVKGIYQSTLSGKKDELLNHIKSQTRYIRDAAYRDQARWKLKTNFDEEVDYLLDWVSKRYDHFEETYGKNSVDIQNDSETNSVPNPTPESPQPSQEL